MRPVRRGRLLGWCWWPGSSAPSAGQRWAVAAAIEQGEGDEVLGFAEPVGDAGEQAQLRVGRLDQRVGQVVQQGGLNAGQVLADPPPELDEGRDA